jgi:hypothetical protein
VPSIDVDTVHLFGYKLRHLHHLLNNRLRIHALPR